MISENCHLEETESPLKNLSIFNLNVFMVEGKNGRKFEDISKLLYIYNIKTNQ